MTQLSGVTAPDSAVLDFDLSETLSEPVKSWLNLWVGAATPLWLPFWTSAGAGLGLWMAAKGFAMNPGFATGPSLCGDRPEGVSGEVADVAVETPHLVMAEMLAPVAEAVTVMEDAVEEMVSASMEMASDLFDELAPEVEALSDEPMAEPVEVVAAETVMGAVVEAVAEVSETAPELVTVAESTVAEVVESAEATVEPVAETSSEVLTEAAETATPPVPPAPRKPKHRGGKG